jgi:hypothetical protein
MASALLAKFAVPVEQIVALARDYGSCFCRRPTAINPAVLACSRVARRRQRNAVAASLDWRDGGIGAGGVLLSNSGRFPVDNVARNNQFA